MVISVDGQIGEKCKTPVKRSPIDGEGGSMPFVSDEPDEFREKPTLGY